MSNLSTICMVGNISHVCGHGNGYYLKGTYFGLDRVYDKIYSLIYKRKAAIRTQTIIDSLKQEIALEIKTNKI